MTCTGALGEVRTNPTLISVSSIPRSRSRTLSPQSATGISSSTSLSTPVTVTGTCAYSHLESAPTIDEAETGSEIAPCWA